MRIRKWLGVIIFCSLSVAETTYMPRSLDPNPWQADSVFIGANLKVKDTMPVSVTLERGKGLLGMLYFMHPSHGDSVVYLFNNKGTQDEHPCIQLGSFTKGTPLIFRYIIVDTSAISFEVKGKRLYSGQNHDGVDPFISERATRYYGRRTAAAGKLDSCSVEVGFEGTDGDGYRSIIFRVQGAEISK